MPRPRGPRPWELNAGQRRRLELVHGEETEAVVQQLEAELRRLGEQRPALPLRAISAVVVEVAYRQWQSRQHADLMDLFTELRRLRGSLLKVKGWMKLHAGPALRSWPWAEAIATLEDDPLLARPVRRPRRPAHRPRTGNIEAVAHLRTLGVPRDVARHLLRIAGALRYGVR